MTTRDPKTNLRDTKRAVELNYNLVAMESRPLDLRPQERGDYLER